MIEAVKKLFTLTKLPSIKSSLPQDDPQSNSTKKDYVVQVNIVRGTVVDKIRKDKYNKAISIIKNDENFVEAFNSIISEKMCDFVEKSLDTNNMDEAFIYKNYYDALKSMLNDFDGYINNTTEENVTQKDV